MIYPLIYIEWCDAMINQSSWVSKEELIDWSDGENWVVKEVGFLIKETKEYILIANKMSCYDKENPELGGAMKIPTTWIRKRKDLSKYVTSS